MSRPVPDPVPDPEISAIRDQLLAVRGDRHQRYGGIVGDDFETHPTEYFGQARHYRLKLVALSQMIVVDPALRPPIMRLAWLELKQGRAGFAADLVRACVGLVG
ncbi:MAG: hypothetical protein CL557_12785 [Alphaproteobacteria bacterium]|nr:hypothetical protein [Alphaproteobacteria bacterium]MAJ64484.1 hypothetical protein [Alphaproteobacteria bacterium]MAJ64516.1 hypothetical protein [Alphaproteobacteria bacterium]MAS48270.1 hypothetical protein [Alphaproteobacteria bacterium]MAX96365.1 hypothetical protein [Alphaproteobacteria bacterium]